MKKAVGIVLLMPLLVFAGIRTVADIQYSRHCGEHLKRAADAGKVPLAIEELETALAYMESHGLTKGSTNVLWETPPSDVGFWYTNISQSLNELRDVAPETTKLERTNILIKLRETLMDVGKNGESVTQPLGISIFPNNVAFAWAGWIASLMGLAGVIIIFRDVEYFR